MTLFDTGMPSSVDEPRCVVFGEMLVDVFHDRLVPGGAPFNVAMHLAGLGLRPHLISRLGHDEEAQYLRVAAQRTGLSLAGLQLDRSRSTGRVEVVEDADGHHFRILQDQAYDHIDADDACASAARYVGGRGTWLYSGTLVLRSPAARASLARLRGSLVHRSYVDLNWRDAGTAPADALDALRGTTILKVSDEEQMQLLAWSDLPCVAGSGRPHLGERSAALRTLLRGLGVEELLVTHGALGAAAWNADGECIASSPAAPVARLVDTVGAGDAFSAMALAQLMLGLGVEELLPRATAFAASICGLRGALPDEPGFYDRWRMDAPVPLADAPVAAALGSRER